MLLAFGMNKAGRIMTAMLQSIYQAYKRVKRVTKTTSIVSGNLNPVWDEHEWVVFENRTWTQFTVRVYDSDFNADDALSDGFMWNLVSHGVYKDRQINCSDSGFVVFDHSF